MNVVRDMQQMMMGPGERETASTPACGLVEGFWDGKMGARGTFRRRAWRKRCPDSCGHEGSQCRYEMDDAKNPSACLSSSCTIPAARMEVMDSWSPAYASRTFPISDRGLELEVV